MGSHKKRTAAAHYHSILRGGDRGDYIMGKRRPPIGRGLGAKTKLALGINLLVAEMRHPTISKKRGGGKVKKGQIPNAIRRLTFRLAKTK